MKTRSKRLNARLMCGAGAAAILALSSAAHAEVRQFDIPALSLGEALARFGTQSDLTVVTTTEITRTKNSQAVFGAVEPEVALAQLLEGTGLTWRREGDTFLIVRAADPQSGSAAGDGAEGTVEALIVTAQKREEDIQDVPIAISAFTQEQLENSQVAGGPDLMTQVPNFTFTKTNFTGYSIQIRGIGTQAISATTDPAVAIAFNNTPFVRNRFFEQEFYDLQRIEVLRGPQGTLYGRNATAGVVNIISQKPKFAYEAKLSADVANYSTTRLEGMVNVPLVEDKVAMRLAGAWTKREGYVTNEITGNPIDGRDLWSTRLSLRFSPNDRFDATLIWEHFEEDDDRLRSGKQLCKTHRVTEVNGNTVPVLGPDGILPQSLSQGCEPASLYSPDSFQVPNGSALPYYGPLAGIGLPRPGNQGNPYVSAVQSHDLRVIESTVDPEYQAETDVVELQFSYDLTDSLTLASETAWASDVIFSMQDFNRFNTVSGAWEIPNRDPRPGLLTLNEDGFAEFCDPQIGCADRLVAVDLSTARSRHFSQEFRLASNYDGPFNFSLGANFLRYDTEDKYYVFINALTLHASTPFSSGLGAIPYVPNVSDNRECLERGPVPPLSGYAYEVTFCKYIDPNPIGSLNDLGHNYFLSKNPFKLISYAAFGEAYYNISDALKVTAGLRWTADKKEAPIHPSWLLAAETIGHPVGQLIEQEWREPTGRLTVDWKPALAFTNETLLYGSYAHGYKAGGANPPLPGLALYGAGFEVPNARFGQSSAVHPQTFDAEFVNAYEVGAKNTLLDGALTLNLAVFYYDYEGYQVSQIVNRSALNYNFDAEVAGAELEADWRPLENLKFGLKVGYEDTRIADGEQAIDTMDRTAGDPYWVTARPFPARPSNCILPAFLYAQDGIFRSVGNAAGGGDAGCELAYLRGVDPITTLPYVPNPPGGPDYPGTPLPNHFPNYPGWDPSTAPNNGEGIFKPLGGNELPNAPRWTGTLSTDYTIPLPSDWLMTLHSDLYYQAEAWTRVFNTDGYDKLKAYTNVNLAAIFTNEDAGWKVMAYVKNVFDRDSITGAFLISDDTGLPTNVFLTEPRLYGLRVTKEWNGGPWWTGANPASRGPFPLTVELGGQVQRNDAPYAAPHQETTDLFTDRLGPLSLHNQDLDWGDGREAKLTWRPGASPWTVSAGLRNSRVNGTAVTHLRAPEGRNCIVGSPAECQALAENPKYGEDLVYSAQGPNNLLATVTNREEHTLIDFVVGRDVGVGSIRSSLKAGVRHAKFESTTRTEMWGVDWQIPDFNVFLSTVSNRHYEADSFADREFEGFGPTLAWEASHPLLGGEETGHLNVDWSIEGGVLFGKQDTTVIGEERERYFVDPKYFVTKANLQQVGPTDVTPIDIAPRSEDVTVPIFGASLGLSYEIQRIKVGAGYRWERYFDVLDGGLAEKEAVDRTIDGPYFKIAVGFGG